MDEEDLFERAFAEWARRYREEPDDFWSEMKRLDATAESYGQAAAAYFRQLITELSQ